MTDTPLHILYKNNTEWPRNAVKRATHETCNLNTGLAEKHFFSEPEASRENITETVFDTLTKIEELLAKKDLNKYLQQFYVSKNVELQQLKNSLRDATKTISEEDFINDVIGG